MMVRLLVAVIIASASPAFAQFVSPAGQSVESCADRRHLEPSFFSSFDVRDAHKVELIQKMRTAQAFTSIVETGECSCEQRFPDWDGAISYYLEHYAGIDDRHEVYAETAVYRDIINSRRLDARAICDAQGNW